LTGTRGLRDCQRLGQIATNTRSNDLYSSAGATTGTVATPANPLNQAVSFGGTALTYDAKGNLTWDGTRSYGYTAENKLTAVTGGNLGYDPLGRLFVVGGEGLLLKYDGDDLVTEHVNSAGNPVARRYVHGPGTDEPLVWYEGAGTSDRRFLHADERGSVIAVTDSAGATIGTNRYDEYGVPAATNAGRFQYTGQMWLPVPGMYSYKARFYAPKLGRFLQPDPIGYADGMNRYAYVGGDPVNFTDPFGLEAGDKGGGPNPHVKPIFPPTDDVAVDNEIVVTGQRESRPCEACKSSGLSSFQINLISNSMVSGTWELPTGTLDCNTAACSFNRAIYVTRKRSLKYLPAPAAEKGSPGKDFCGSATSPAVPDKVGRADLRPLVQRMIPAIQNLGQINSLATSRWVRMWQSPAHLQGRVQQHAQP
jgi:RHS repeat-associated protein